MAEQATKEPTMEEILSSIRRIISEGGDAEAHGVEATEPTASIENVSLDAETDDAFDVSELLGHNETPVAENENDHLLSVDELLSSDDLDFEDEYSLESDDISTETLSEDASPEPQVELDDAFVDSDDDDLLLAEINAMSDEEEVFAETTSETVESTPELKVEPAMAKSNTQTQSTPDMSSLGAAAVGGNTIEGMVAGLMQPIIQEWIDTNLPNIVEARVEAEINQIAAKVISALRD